MDDVKPTRSDTQLDRGFRETEGKELGVLDDTVLRGRESSDELIQGRWADLSTHNDHKSAHPQNSPRAPSDWAELRRHISPNSAHRPGLGRGRRERREGLRPHALTCGRSQTTPRARISVRAERQNAHARNTPEMRTRPRDTTPPRVLPLLPIAFIAVALGQVVVALSEAALVLTGIENLQPGDDLTRTDVATSAVPQIVALVALSFVLRWLIERWVERYPPRPGTRNPT